MNKFLFLNYIDVIAETQGETAVS